MSCNKAMHHVLLLCGLMPYATGCGCTNMSWINYNGKWSKNILLADIVNHQA